MDEPLLEQCTSPRRSRPKASTHQHRILVYTTCYNVLDGVTLTIRKIEQEILAAGHHVCILTTKSGAMSNTHLDGEHPNRRVVFLDNSVALPFTEDPKNPELQYYIGFSISKDVRAQIAEFEPSLIHITAPDCTCLHLIQYAREREIPIMGTYHSNIPEYMTHYRGLGWLKPILAAFFRHQYNFLQALYVPTPFIHRYLSDSYQYDRVTDLNVWGRGIDLDRFSTKYRSQKFRAQMGFEEDDVVICWVGRLVPEKRPDIFCNVIRRLHERNVAFKVLVVGAGQYEDEVKALPNTKFCGWLAGDALSTAYASSDIFLFPSGVETFGNVTLEAAASGLPLVVEAGCSGHLVNDGLNGFACNEFDEDAFFESTMTLVLDDTMRKTMSEEGRKFSLKFEKRAVCQKMLGNYAQVTDEFYLEYGGHHANRDRAYQHEGSFIGGTHPRPFLLTIVEVIFIVLFRMMYYVSSCLVYMRRRPEVTPILAGDSSSLSSPTNASSLSSPTSASVLRLPTSDSPEQLSTISKITEVEECSDSESEGQQDGDVFRFVKTKADDDTVSTTSLSEHSQSSKRSEKWYLAPKLNLKIADSMAVAFVQFMLFQFRLESRIRETVNRCISSSPPNNDWDVGQRKRKNSNLTVNDFRKNRHEPSLEGLDIRFTGNSLRNLRQPDSPSEVL